MAKKMTLAEMAAMAAEMRDKRRAHVVYECGEEGEQGIVALTFEVEDSGEGPYQLKFHRVCYDAGLGYKLEDFPYWPYWMKKRRFEGGNPVKDDPLIKRGPGAFPKDDGQIDRIENHWIHSMGVSLMGYLGCTVRYKARTRMHPERENFFPFIPKELRGV